MSETHEMSTRVAAMRRSRIAIDLYGADLRHRLIAETAYRLAQSRGFGPGHEVEDWLSAEAQVDTALTLGELML
jgi:Protein of unknown function (DUF2934)